MHGTNSMKTIKSATEFSSGITKTHQWLAKKKTTDFPFLGSLFTCTWICQIYTQYQVWT